MFIHLNDFISVDDGQIKPIGIMLGKFCADSILAAHQVDAQAVLAGSLHGPQHNLAGGIVTAHGIQGNTDSRPAWRSLIHRGVPSGSPIVAFTSSRSLSRSKGL